MGKKIIILSRVSSQPQDIHSQTNELKREAEKLGYDENHQIVIESIESAIKLSEDQRLGIISMKNRIENDPSIDCVICWEVSRLARRQKDLYSIRDYLVERKIQLYIITPYVKLLTNDRSQVDTTANLAFSIFATIAENEMSLKKDRFARAKNELKSQGKKFGGATIFGYEKNKDKRCIPHPVYSKIIVDLFNHYVTTDDSLYETYLYAMGKYPEIFKPLDYKKSQRKIKHYFDTEVYVTGNWCYSPIIAKDIWDKTHEKMRNAKCGPRFNCKRDLLCRGKIYCGFCGAMMTGCGGNVKAYICNNKDKFHSLQINCDIADWIMWEELAPNIAIHSHADYIHAINVTQQRINATTELKNHYETEIKSLDVSQSRLVDLYLTNQINETIFNLKNGDINTSKELYTKKLEDVNIKLTTYQTILEESQRLCAENANKSGIDITNIDDFNTRLDYVRKYINKMIVTKDKDRDHTMLITFEYTKPIARKESKYLYTYHNQENVRVIRINEDNTEDLIYTGNYKHKRNKKTGRFEKSTE